jgi:hypothetical protein
LFEGIEGDVPGVLDEQPRAVVQMDDERLKRPLVEHSLELLSDFLGFHAGTLRRGRSGLVRPLSTGATGD